MNIQLVAGFGVEGDAHAGATVRHRYLARRDPTMPNLRQVHLIAEELFDHLRGRGYAVGPGDLGENVTTSGIDLIHLPLGTKLQIGDTVIVELTGLRTPCVLIDRFQAGLKNELVEKESNRSIYKAGVMGVVETGGQVCRGDPISVELPARPWTALPAIG